jgi:hypothetical protein
MLDGRNVQASRAQYIWLVGRYAPQQLPASCSCIPTSANHRQHTHSILKDSKLVFWQRILYQNGTKYVKVGSVMVPGSPPGKVFDFQHILTNPPNCHPFPPLPTKTALPAHAQRHASSHPIFYKTFDLVYFEAKEREYRVRFHCADRITTKLGREMDEAISIYPAGGALLTDGSTVRAETVQELHDAINAHGKIHGYAVIRKGGGGRNKQGVYTYFGIFCDRYGEPRPSEGTGLRKTSTRKSGCEFRGSVHLTDQGWVFRHHKDPRHHVHNHPPSLDPSAHPQHRKMKSPVKDLVKKMSNYTAIRAREINSILQADQPDSNFTIKDINNARQGQRREEMDGCTASGAVVRAFDQGEISYAAKWDPQDPNRLLGLVFTFPECQEMWKRFPDCLSLDNTYSTNALGFPLFVGTTQTNINSIANVVFGLIDNERREGFDFLVQSLNELRVRIEARSPLVTVTDKDDQMRDALKAVFPDTQQQLCRFHINANVLLQAKKKGKWSPPPVEDDEEGLRDV